MTPIFLETILPVETAQETQSNLGESGHPNISNSDFLWKTDLSIFLSVAPQLFEWSSETSWFSQTEMNMSLPTSVLGLF